MLENQETHKSPDEKEVVFKNSITQRDKMKLSRVVKESMKVDIDLGDLPAGVDASKLSPGETQGVRPTVKDVNLADLDENKQRATIEVMVVSYDGKTDVWNTLLDGSPAEFDFVFTKAEELLNKVSF